MWKTPAILTPSSMFPGIPHSIIYSVAHYRKHERKNKHKEEHRIKCNLSVLSSDSKSSIKGNCQYYSENYWSKTRVDIVMQKQNFFKALFLVLTLHPESGTNWLKWMHFLHPKYHNMVWQSFLSLVPNPIHYPNLLEKEYRILHVPRCFLRPFPLPSQ